MATKPTVSPAWATSDVVDPTSGQNNKIEPPAGWKTNGWSYQEKPARNYDNWVKWNLGEWINYLDTATVRAPTYKVAASDSSADSQNQADAVCDGTADDIEINAAITAVAATGGVVLLSEGTFVIDSTINMDTDVHLVGAGTGATVVQFDGATAATIMVLASAKSDCSLSNMTLDGNKTALSTGCVGVQLTSTCSQITLRNLSIKDISTSGSDGDGVRIDTAVDCRFDDVWLSGCEGNGTNILSTGSPARCVFSRCTASNCGSNGFLVNGTDHRFLECRAWSCSLSGFADAASTDTSYSACIADACGTTTVPAAAFAMGPGARAVSCYARDHVDYTGFELGGDGIMLSGCVADGNGRSGIAVNASSNCLISGCISRGNGYNGISLSSLSTENVVTGCMVVGNSKSADDTYSGISISDASNMIHGNMVKRGTGFAHLYGLNASAAGSYIFANDLTNSSKSGGAGGSVNGSGDTIPEFTGSSASANVSDSISNANRT